MVLECFVILCYNKASPNTCLDKEHMDLFAKGRQMTSLPPTKGALKQKIKRTLLLAGWNYGQATLPTREIPSYLLLSMGGRIQRNGNPIGQM